MREAVVGAGLERVGLLVARHEEGDSDGSRVADLAVPGGEEGVCGQREREPREQAGDDGGGHVAPARVLADEGGPGGPRRGRGGGLAAGRGQRHDPARLGHAAEAGLGALDLDAGADPELAVEALERGAAEAHALAVVELDPSQSVMGLELDDGPWLSAHGGDTVSRAATRPDLNG